jgi:hypothetical protein
MVIRRFKQTGRTLLQRLGTHRGSFLAGALVLVAAVLSALWLHSTDEWGALGQWAGAFGTVLAVTVALRIAQREVEDKTERNRAGKAEYELEQARLVVAEIKYPPVRDEIYFKQQFDYDPPDTVQITNYSRTHVFHPRVEGFIHQNGGTVIWDIGAEDPDEYNAPTVLGAGEVDRIPVSLTFDPPISEDMYPMRTKVVIGFTDADGRRWRRVGDGKPERVEAGDTFDIGGPDWYRANR